MAWITGADVLAAAGCPSATTAVQADAAANAACAMVERWCKRKIEAATYREWKGRAGPRTLLVDNPPIRRLYRASISTQYGLSLSNTSADANGATVTVQDGVLGLTVFGGANDGDESITLSTTATMADLVTAIAALAKGWTASVENEGDPQDIRPDNLGSVLNTTVYLTIPYESAEVSLLDRNAGS